MTIFVDARCRVDSCPFNKGERGVTCGFAGYGKPCRHPVYQEAWRAVEELEQALQAEAHQARSLVARVSATGAPLTVERARQLALSFKGGDDGQGIPA